MPSGKLRALLLSRMPVRKLTSGQSLNVLAIGLIELSESLVLIGAERGRALLAALVDEPMQAEPPALLREVVQILALQPCYGSRRARPSVGCVAG